MVDVKYWQPPRNFENISFLNKQNEKKKCVDCLFSYSTILEPYFSARDNKDSAFPQFNIRQKHGKSGCATRRRLRRLMDVRRRAWSSRGNLVLRLCVCSYLPTAYTVLHAINKSYYTPLARCFFMNLSSTVRYGRRRASMPLMAEFIHKRISLYHLRPAYVRHCEVAALCKTRDNLKICACS